MMNEQVSFSKPISFIENSIEVIEASFISWENGIQQ